MTDNGGSESLTRSEIARPDPSEPLSPTYSAIMLENNHAATSARPSPPEAPLQPPERQTSETGNKHWDGTSELILPVEDSDDEDRAPYARPSFGQRVRREAEDHPPRFRYIRRNLAERKRPLSGNSRRIPKQTRNDAYESVTIINKFNGAVECVVLNQYGIQEHPDLGPE
ncbi:hypothetical protein AURDEDRAFT_129236 [Auricularia subglabra TFB-10046 SS5]|nr:hypothetical protein AURDEDRAFT_129236 [Auricularia subglabra TFB-10046 SS5]